jgi:hypothetical protein
MLQLIWLTTLALAGGDPCDKGRVKDAGDGVSIHFGGADWSVSHSGNTTLYETRLFGSGVGTTLRSGFTLGAMLEDGSAVHFTLDEPVEGHSHTSETGSFTQWDTTFAVQSETVQRLATAQLTATRADLGTGPVTTAVGRGRAKKIQGAFQCVAAHLEG